MEWKDKLISSYKTGTEGIKVIYVSVGATLLFWIIHFIFLKVFLYDITPLLLLSAEYFIPYIWTIITFPFIYLDIFNLFFVMLMVYFIERIFRIYFNGESFVKFFIFGNIVGSIIFLLFSYIGSVSVFAQGAIFGVYSVLFAVISYNPKMKVTLFPLPVQTPLYLLGIIILVLDIFSMHDFKLPVLMGRIMSAAFGFLYMKAYQSGDDFLGNLVLRFKNKKFSKKNKKHQNSKPGEGYSQRRTDTQKKVDEILDKISKNGYESLTKEEKDILFKQSK